jgi:GXGXG motif
MAVVEGVGQHGCEYMTAGVVILLGPAGMNLGSGMTGGLVYALREAFEEGNCNQEFVRCAAIDEQEEEWLRSALREHVRLTGSPCARRLLRDAKSLPLERWEPVRLPCTVRETWAPILERWERRTILSLPLAGSPQSGESRDRAIG